MIGGNYDPATMNPGVYTYTVTGIAPCANASAMVTVTENASANAGTDGVLTLCITSPDASLFAVLGGGAQAGGIWSGPSPVVGGMFSPATMSAGGYIYTVSGNAPCPADQSTVTVNVVAAPNAGTNGSATVCGNGPAIDLFAQLGGGPDAGGAWSGPSPVLGGSYDPTTMAPGVYTYTIAAVAPCVGGSATVTVTESAPADAGTSSSVTVCDVGAATSLFAQLGGAPQAGGTWSGPSPVAGGSYDPATMNPGVYTYTVTGVAPCANASATVTVTESASPNAGTNGSATVCGNGPAIDLFAQLGGGPDAGGAWSGPSPVLGGSYDPTTMAPGVYTYTIAAVAPCVGGSATVTVTESAPADAGTSSSVTVCDVGAAISLFAQLGGAPQAGGTWSGPSPVVGGSYDPATMNPGVYTYTVTGVAPCANASATVTVTESASPNAGTNGSATVCGNGPAIDLFAQLGGGPDAGGAWSGPSPVLGGSYDPTTMAPGVYTYTIAAVAPCVGGSATVTVTESAPADAGTSSSVTVCDVGAATSLFAQLGGAPQAGGTWSGPSPVVGGSYDPATMNPGVYTYTVTGVAPCANASATVTVTESASPNAGTNGSATVCGNGPAIDLFAQLGGGPDAGGAWSGPSPVLGGSYDPTTMAPGVYTYTIAAVAPCASASTSVTISEETPLNAGTSASIDLCPGSVVVNLFALLGGSPQAGGTWTHPGGAPFSGTFDPAVDPAGGQTYTVTGVACPTATAIVTVTLLPGPNAGGDNSIALCNTDGAFTLLSQLLGAPDPGGIWTDAQGNSVADSFNPATMTSGTFTYTVQGVGTCPNDQATLSIQVNIAPLAGSSGSLTLCASSPTLSLFEGLSGTLDAGGVWTSPDGAAHGTTLDPTLDASGTYTYIVTGIAPCPSASSTVQVVINPVPVAGEDGSLSTCTTAPALNLISLLGGSPQPGGTWSGPGGNTVSSTFNPAVHPPGVYTYTITGITPCVDDVAEVVIAVSIAGNAGTSSVITLCSDDAPIDLLSSLGGTPDATGVWTAPDGSPAENGFNPDSDEPGTYTYTVTPTTPCPQVSATVNIGVVQPAVASFMATSDGSCVPVEVTFTHAYSGPGICTWILGNGVVIEDCAPVTVTYDQAGSYDVTLIVDAGNGCGADTVTVQDAVTAYSQPTAGFEMVPERITTLNPVAFFTNTSAGANGYVWLIDGVYAGNETDLRHVFPAQIGDTYGVCLVAVASAQCTDTVCRYITLEDGMVLWVPNTFTPNDDDKNDGFAPVVIGIDPRFYRFEVFDRWGLLVFSSETPGEAWDGMLSGVEAPQDVYVWKVRVKDSFSGDRVERVGHVNLLR
ncbi:MAG: gliding motility-associated C-terminal domain-containing protein [Flavobacteriales bacterium]|nr:gliding motility-associated C-terminal domain-containing protein [Flavobacteriales bacterium]